MTMRDLDAVMRVEAGSYSHPWTHGNFADSLAAGHLARMLVDEATPAPGDAGAAHEPRDEGQDAEQGAGQGAGPQAGQELVAYLVAMPAAGTMHLLNLTVAPDHRRQGHARHLLDWLADQARCRGLEAIWLEVRASNVAARRLYGACGYTECGKRRAYYPAGHSLREDAVLMSLVLGGTVPVTTPLEARDAAG